MDESYWMPETDNQEEAKMDKITLSDFKDLILAKLEAFSRQVQSLDLELCPQVANACTSMIIHFFCADSGAHSDSESWICDQRHFSVADWSSGHWQTKSDPSFESLVWIHFHDAVHDSSLLSETVQDISQGRHDRGSCTWKTDLSFPGRVSNCGYMDAQHHQ